MPFGAVVNSVMRLRMDRSSMERLDGARNWHTPQRAPNQRLLRMMKRNALVFDLDGTLVDSLPDLAAALAATWREIGAPALPREQVRAMIGDGTRHARRARGRRADRDRRARAGGGAGPPSTWWRRPTHGAPMPPRPADIQIDAFRELSDAVARLDARRDEPGLTAARPFP